MTEKTFTTSEVTEMVDTYLRILLTTAEAYSISEEEKATAKRVLTGFKNTVNLTAAFKKNEET